jgi:hypothetical protein
MGYMSRKPTSNESETKDKFLEKINKKSEKRFPIQRAGSVPWSEAEIAYKYYAKFFGSRQTLERLAERGGFCPAEFCSLYLGISPTRPRKEQFFVLIARVAAELGNKWIFPEDFHW